MSISHYVTLARTVQECRPIMHILLTEFCQTLFYETLSIRHSSCQIQWSCIKYRVFVFVSSHIKVSRKTLKNNDVVERHGTQQ